MELKHTPGPWEVNSAGSAKRGEAFKIDEYYVFAPHVQDDTAICSDVIEPVSALPSEANARLIAASPEMLEALLLFVEYEKDSESNDDVAMMIAYAEFKRAAHSAIAAATGE